jgi:hypothetical protein
VHVLALLSAFVSPPMQISAAITVRHDNRYTSRAGPPLLRPPNS